MMSIKISGMAVDMEVTEKGTKLLRVADKRCVHTVCVSDDFVWNNDMRGKTVEVEGFTKDGVFMFATRGNGKK